jgi:serine/threonine-protein kinase
MTSAYGARGGEVTDRQWMRGEVLDGDYRIERLLGEGGMGIVVAARHVRTGEEVAIKLIRRERVSDPMFLKRFLREASIALQLRGARVAQVLRIGLLPSGLPYLVMEYLQGETLEAALRERGPLPIDVAVDCVLEACDAIAEAHAAGIAHRDLKPANLFLTRTPDGGTRVKVIDFGISKWIGGRDSSSRGPHVSTTDVPIGSPSYMSPEQLLEVALADPRSDVWALGVILFELITGRLPFAAESIAAVQVAVLHDEPPSLRSLVPSAPPTLDAVYQRCLVKDRAARMASVHDLVVALAPFASAQGRALAGEIAARMPRPATTVVPGDGAVPQIAATTAGPRRAWRRRALIASAVLAGGVGVGLPVLRGLTARPPAAATAAATTPAPPPPTLTAVSPPGVAPIAAPIAPATPVAAVGARQGAIPARRRTGTHGSRGRGRSAIDTSSGSGDEVFSTRQ